MSAARTAASPLGVSTADDLPIPRSRSTVHHAASSRKPAPSSQARLCREMQRPGSHGCRCERSTTERLYGFLDLLALLVASELNDRGVSVQHLREVVGHLKSRGYDRPLSQLTFATISNRVYFQHDDGTWEGDLPI